MRQGADVAPEGGQKKTSDQSLTVFQQQEASRIVKNGLLTAREVVTFSIYISRSGGTYQ